MDAEEIADEIRGVFACMVDYCEGVSMEKISDKKYAIPLITEDGSRFGIIVEKLN